MRFRIVFAAAVLSFAIWQLRIPPPAPPRPQNPAVLRATPVPDFDPYLRTDLLARLQSAPTAGSRDLFQFVVLRKRSQVVVPPLDSQPVILNPDTSSTPQPTGQSEVEPLTYYGLVESRARRALFRDGDTLYIVREGDTIAGKYKVIQISVDRVVIEDLPHGTRRSLPMTDPNVGQLSSLRCGAT